MSITRVIKIACQLIEYLACPRGVRRRSWFPKIAKAVAMLPGGPHDCPVAATGVLNGGRRRSRRNGQAPRQHLPARRAIAGLGQDQAAGVAGGTGVAKLMARRKRWRTGYSP
jgi:hypothetical protein